MWVLVVYQTRRSPWLIYNRISERLTHSHLKISMHFGHGVEFLKFIFSTPVDFLAQVSISFLDSHMIPCIISILAFSSRFWAYLLITLYSLLISAYSWFSVEFDKISPSDFGVQFKFWNLILPFRLFDMVGTKLNQPRVNIHSRKFSWYESQQTAVS